MKYLGMDVHGKATVYCVLDGEGNVVDKGEVATTTMALTELVRGRLSSEALICGQEVGAMSHFVHEVTVHYMSSGLIWPKPNCAPRRMETCSKRRL